MRVPASFDYQPLTRVIVGPGTLSELGKAASGLGGKRVLLVTDPGLESAGHPQRAVEFLREAGLSVVLFDGVRENPTTKNVLAGLKVAQAAEVDLLIAIGGGSAMDCAKGINFLYTNGGEMKDYWGTGKATKAMLPSIGIPTTSGTGSEAQSYALISDPTTHIKMACGDKKAAFKVAILDPELTLTQPEHVAAFTGLDAMTHAIEAHVSSKSSVLSRLYSREAFGNLSSNFEKVFTEPQNLVARSAMQWGAHLAGLAIENAMLGAAHALANPLTAHFGIVHGKAVSLMLPHVIRFNADHVSVAYMDLLNQTGTSSMDPHDAAEKLARLFREYAARAGVPEKLRDAGVSQGMLNVLADEASQQWTGKFNPRPVGYNELLKFYETAF